MAHRADPRAVAFWSVLSLATLSVTVRPLVSLLGLPTILRNADALLTPVAAVAVGVCALAGKPQLSRSQVVLVSSLAGLWAFALVSWSTNDPHSVTSLGLTFTSLLLMPTFATLIGIGAGHGARAHEVALLQALVLLQLVVGLAQYVMHDVAQRAPLAADLVDGTTSHNFWPAFALPASGALLLLDQSWTRWVWPVGVIALAVYAEAKAALIIYLPILAVLAILTLAVESRSWWSRHGRRATLSWSAIGRALLLLVTAGIVVLGLVWTPSVQGTWAVFVSHTEQLTGFHEGTASAVEPVTYRDALRVLGDEVPASPWTALTGLGPANSVSHAADVLVHDAQPDSARVGPVANRLLRERGDLQFEDAQSSVLGVWGDLGILGALAYAGVMLSAAWCLTRFTRGEQARRRRIFSVVATGLGVLAGGIALDWPEQAAIVLPVALTLMAVSRRPESAAAGAVGPA